MKAETLTRWTVEESADAYGIRNWGQPYFEISDKGEVVAALQHATGLAKVSLHEIATGCKARGLDMPVLLRFSNILASRVSVLNESFRKAIREQGYQAEYRGVYPIKVNQQQHVIEEIMRYGRQYHHGLEAGSKGEFIAALAYVDDPEALLICNGYKDEEFVNLALYALKMGIQTMLVLEMPSELNMILECARKLNVRPRIGVRAKLAVRAGGHWTDSGGDRSPFGLNASEIVDVIDRLRAESMLDCLQMLHYHVGSQIPNIRSIRQAVSEAARVYVDMAREGAAMGFLDVGGGLAVDYDGSHTNFPSSRNYTLDEYTADIVEVVMKVINEAGLAHPMLVSESGRYTVAHHSVLLFNIYDVSRFESHAVPDELPANTHEMVRNLMDVRRNLCAKNLQEAYHDALFYRDECRTLFVHGAISLRERGLAERIFWNIANRIAVEAKGRKYIPDELQGLEAALADVYYGNLSIFQSLPDSWAIEQLFPIMPIHRLDEMPTRQATLADITCDCDGRIARFTDLHDVRNTLPLHELQNGTDYILGVFLVGAYQETLGDLHNLFGDTNVMNIRANDAGEVEFVDEIDGDTVADVLSYVEYDIPSLVNRMREFAERAVRNGRISVQERRQILDAYENGIRGYTYFES